MIFIDNGAAPEKYDWADNAQVMNYNFYISIMHLLEF